MKPRSLKNATEIGYKKRGYYISSRPYLPDKVRIDLVKQLGNSFDFVSFWVTRKYAERMGYKNCY